MEKTLQLLVFTVACWIASASPRPPTVDETIRRAREHGKAESYDQEEDVLVELDMRYTKEKWAEMTSKIDTHKGLKDERFRWTNKVIPYVINNIFNSQQTAAIKAGMAEWERYTCIRFKPRYNEWNYINVVDGGGCSSYVGMIGGGQPVTLARRGCIWHHTIVHELGHAVGYHHEQTRPDRDNYVWVYLNNVLPDMRFNFDKYSWNKIDDQGVPYDYRSVMHYGETAFSMNGRRTMETKDPAYQHVIGRAPGLSYRDIKAANLMYKCGDHCNVKCPSESIVSQDCKCWCPSGYPQDPVMECDSEGSGGGSGDGSGDGSGSEDCYNYNERCEEWANRGECSINPNYMLWNCPKACGICGENIICKNYDDYCDTWAGQGYCWDPNYEEYMRRFCGKACSRC